MARMVLCDELFLLVLFLLAVQKEKNITYLNLGFYQIQYIFNFS